MLTHECVFADSDKAEFKSINQDWPSSFTVEFNQPDFTLEEFIALAEALNNFNSCGQRTPTDENRAIVNRAHELGYAHKMSWSQASWSEAGVKAFREAESLAVSEVEMSPGC